MKQNEINTQTKAESNTIFLEREIVVVSGKEYANYFVRGTFTLRGKSIEKKIRMDVPKNDVGMYDVLDMIFGERNKMELYKRAKVNRDMTTGKKTTTYRYEVAEDDLIARIVPSGESNSALLDKLYKDLNKEIEIEDDESEE